jgi:hypothetical protein
MRADTSYAKGCLYHRSACPAMLKARHRRFRYDAYVRLFDEEPGA